MDAVINTEEFIGKTVGRRTKVNPLLLRREEIPLKRQWSSGPFATPIRRGVYRFRSHEEADQWLMDHMTRKPAN